jgi:RNA polymerase sigma-70 factor (ECF subfamily)
METEGFPHTSAALLLRLARDRGDADAWARLVRTYGPRILQWARRWGLQDADAQDLTQMVLIQFYRQIPRFQYDSSRRFRGWLRRLVHAAFCDLAERRRAWHQGKGGSGVTAMLNSLAARDELAEQIEKEHDRAILRLAMERVQARVQPQTWRAFWLLNVDGLSGQDVAASVGMRQGTAYAASSKVRRMIHAEVQRLESDTA